MPGSCQEESPLSTLPFLCQAGRQLLGASQNDQEAEAQSPCSPSSWSWKVSAASVFPTTELGLERVPELGAGSVGTVLVLKCEDVSLSLRTHINSGDVK